MNRQQAQALTVYLAGPMAAAKSGEINDWRQMAERALKDWRPSIRVINPYTEEVFDDPLHVLHGDAAIVRRDLQHVRDATVLLANLRPSAQVSIGTMFELAWAYQLQIPVVTVRDTTHHDHPMVREASTILVDHVYEGVEAIQLIYRDY